MNQVILDTNDPNVKLIHRTSGNNLQTIRQTTSSGGEVASGEGETTETITIVRQLLNSTAE